MSNLGDLVSVIAVGLLGGVMVALQGPMSGVMSQHVGAFASSFIIHMGGAIASALLILVGGGVNLSELHKIPKPFFLAGIFGVILYMTFAYTLPRVGATVATALLILAQLCIGMILDHFGWLGVAQHSFSLARFAGLILLTAGAWLVTQ
jgi:transporter family-2 protein